MTKQEAHEMASMLMKEHGHKNMFEVSMPDQEAYNTLRAAFTELGVKNVPDGDFFIVKIYPQADAAEQPLGVRPR